MLWHVDTFLHVPQRAPQIYEGGGGKYSGQGDRYYITVWVGGSPF